MFATVGSLAALLFLVYVPGAMLFRMPLASRDRRAALRAEERAFWAVILSVAVTSIAAFLLAAAGSFTFRRLLVAVSAVVAAALSAFRGRLRLSGAAPATRTVLLPILLAASGCFLFFPPAEYIMGGRDPGVYISEGLQIARGGSLVVRDPLAGAMAPEWHPLFFPIDSLKAGRPRRFMGFYFLKPDGSYVVGEFPHLYPVWVAIGYGLNGVDGALQSVGACAILGLLSVYFLGARLLGSAGAAAAAGLLALNPAEIWFARYPTSELLTQALLFAGLLAYARAHVERDRFFAPIAGVLLGLLPLLRIDGVIVLGMIAALVALGPIAAATPGILFVVVLGFVLAGASVYLATWMQSYMDYPLAYMASLRGLALPLAMAGLIVIVGVRAAARRWGIERIRTLLTLVLVVGIAAGAAYAYFFRTPSGLTALHDAYALRAFTFYITRGGLLLAVVGFALVAPRLFKRDPLFVLTAVAYACFFFYKPRIVPEHFWMARRFLPVILPATLLFIVGGLLVVVGKERDVSAPAVAPRGAQDPLPVGGGFVFVLLLPLVWQLASASMPLLRHVEYKGLVGHVRDLAGRFTTKDLIVIESRDASDLHVLGPPLTYLHDRDTVTLSSLQPDKNDFADFLEWARRRYVRVLFIGSGGTDLLSARIAATAIASGSFAVPQFDQPLNIYPKRVSEKVFDWTLYQFVDAANRPAPSSVDLGAFDDLQVVNFNQKERAGNTTFRWSSDDRAYVTLPFLHGDERVVILRAASTRPSELGDPRLEVSLNGRPLGGIVLRTDFAEYRLAIPTELSREIARRRQPAMVELATDTWRPADFGVDDGRTLGAMLDRIEIR